MKVAADKQAAMLLTLFGIASLCYTIYFFALRVWESFCKLPPGPFPLPLVGNAHLLSDKPHHDFTRLAKSYGPIYKLQLGTQLAVIISDLDLVREAAKKGTDFSGRPKMISGEIFSGCGKSIGFQTYSDEWRRQHKVFTTAIRACEGKNGKLEGIALREMEQLHQRLRQQCGSIVDPRDDFGLTMANIISELLFGFTFEKSDKDFHAILEETLKFSQGLRATNILDALPFLEVFPFQVVKVMKEAVAERDAILQPKHETHSMTFREGKTRDIWDALMQAELDEKALGLETPCLDEQRRKYTLNESMIATESALTAFMWTVALLTEYPDVQRKLQAAIDDVTNRNKVTLTSKDRSRLPYVEAVFIEAQRVAPVSPAAIPHCTMSDTKLAGFNIPKGTTAIFNLWAVHRDPKLWHSPEIFDPDRMINKDGKFTGALKVIPFSVGHRSCPWEATSRQIFFIIIANLFREFTFEKVPGYPMPDVMECPLGITFSPPPYKLLIKKRA